MTHAYSELYLEQAMDTLGRMTEFAVNDLNYDADDFFDMFTGTACADGFAHGDPWYTVGLSGEELAYDVLWEVKRERCLTEPSFCPYRSEAYWGGWIIAGYQWYRNVSFRRIRETISLQEVIDHYMPYHEMDEMQFYDVMDNYMMRQAEISRLKRLRMYAGMSQSQLAVCSGIPLRTIQQYEQRQKDINRAKASTVQQLSDALGCGIEELMEIHFKPANKKSNGD